MLELRGENLVHRYGRVEAIRGVDITLRPGSAHALVGPSGSGKSTLLMLLAGLLRPTCGRIVLCDNGTSRAVLKPPPRLGVAFQPPGLWDHLRVDEHLKLVRRDGSPPVEQVLEIFRLRDLRRRRPGELSSGQRQRLSLARAIAAHPQWLLLDEPLAHLDAAARQELTLVLRKVLDETCAAMLITSHERDSVAHLADTAAVLREGRITQA